VDECNNLNDREISLRKFRQTKVEVDMWTIWMRRMNFLFLVDQLIGLNCEDHFIYFGQA
jgi:hypothetical protein